MEDADALRAQGASVMHLAVNGAITGIIAVSDRIKSTTPEALARLKEDGIHAVMARGDGVVTASTVTKKLGIDALYGEVKPAQVGVSFEAAGRGKGRRHGR
ncbi:hypothetical protein BKK81_33490 (plasmid) [Cupriavidus sp. USMAHM13]|nr:hypothetical protein BKK81_33490 [Cupriavidus sp. USMAHM13]